MFFLWFGRKKELEEHKEETKKGFDAVKADINKVGDWIKHLNDRDLGHENEIIAVREDLSTIKQELEEIKESLILIENKVPRRVFQQVRQLSNRQTADQGCLNSCLDSRLDSFFSQFSTSEKTIVWILANSDMKLGYDDLSAMLGKERSTVRNQVNNIKSKAEGLIQETIEKTGKKRLFINEKTKEMLLKEAKVRIGKRKKEAKKAS